MNQLGHNKGSVATFQTEQVGFFCQDRKIALKTNSNLLQR